MGSMGCLRASGRRSARAPGQRSASRPSRPRLPAAGPTKRSAGRHAAAGYSAGPRSCAARRRRPGRAAGGAAADGASRRPRGAQLTFDDPGDEPPLAPNDVSQRARRPLTSQPARPAAAGGCRSARQQPSLGPSTFDKLYAVTSARCCAFFSGARSTPGRGRPRGRPCARRSAATTASDNARGGGVLRRRAAPAVALLLRRGRAEHARTGTAARRAGPLDDEPGADRRAGRRGDDARADRRAASRAVGRRREALAARRRGARLPDVARRLGVGDRSPARGCRARLRR